MKKFLKRLGLWGMAVLLAASFVQHRRVSERMSYAHMQESTVYIDAGDASGSGVVIQRGNRVFVWTANHVVDNDTTITVKKFVRLDGRKVGEVSFKARLLGRDAARDLALFWLDAPVGYFRPAEFASDAIPAVGTALTHVGNVLGSEFDGSVSTGILSQVGVAPSNPGWPWKHTTDQGTFAAFYGGSGGPVFVHNDRTIAGILVGGLVGKGYISYVPVREISALARKAGLSWAVHDTGCPSDEVLRALVVNVNLFNVN